MTSLAVGGYRMALAEGQQLGQYKIIGQIGHGGMATIYQAYHARLDRYVAIKVLHQGFLQDPNFLARFEREAQIVAKLEHPNIVPIYDFADVNGQPYLVMKYVAGQTLKAINTQHGVSLNEILRIMPPIASALDYAHRSGVLHRDIKPSNIIIGDDGTPYLTDFGLARMAQLGESTLSADVMLGTPNYISPEQAMGRKDVDARTDLYSLGVVLYELVTGQVPFSADTPYAVIHDHIYSQLPAPSSINPEIPPQVEAVLIKSLAKNPDDRYSSAGEMMTAFATAVRSSGLKSLHVQPQAAPDEVETPNASSFDPFDAVIDQIDEEEQRDTVVLDMPPLPQKPQPSGKHNVSFNVDQGKIEAQLQWGNTQKSWQIATDKINQQLSDAGKMVSDALQNAASSSRESGEKPKNKPNPWKEAGAALKDAIEENVESLTGEDGLYLDTPESARKRAEKQVNKRKEFGAHLAAFVAVNALLWVIYAVTMGGGFPWPLLVLFGWGSGLLAHSIETYYETGKRAAKKTQSIFDAYYRAYGPNWNRQSKKALRKVRKAVTKPLDKRREFYQHLSVYITIIPLLWIIYGLTSGFGAEGFLWPLIVMLGWGVGLVAHGVDTINSVREDQAIERQIEREAQYLYGSGSSPKRKNDDLSLDELQADEPDMRLSSDGELTDSMVDRLRQDNLKSRKR